MTLLFVPYNNPFGPTRRCEVFDCWWPAAWRGSASGSLLCQGCYQRAMVRLAYAEVLHILSANAPASATWNVQHGVSAFEVLAGYTNNETLRDWIARDASGEGYQRFLAYWNAAVS